MALIRTKTIAKAKERSSTVTKGGVTYQKVDTAALAEVATIAKNLAENSSDWAKIDQKDRAVLAAAMQALAEASAALDGKYLSKTEDDTAEGVITFKNGLISLALALLQGGAEYGRFVEGVSGGRIDSDGNGELENLTVRDSIVVPNLTVTKAAHFFKLIIDELKSIGGQIIVTAANATLDKVVAMTSTGNEAGDGDTIAYWRCYFRAKDADGKAIHNQFDQNDMAVCMTFDAAEGTSYNVSNKYYWRKVIVRGTETLTDGETGEETDYHYIDLSATDKDPDCNGVPEVGDAVAQLGNSSDTTRQNAIIISAYQGIDTSVEAPSIVQYKGINDYDLRPFQYNVIAANGNVFRGDFRSISSSTADQSLDELISGLSGQVDQVKGQVDNKFEIWYGHGTPTLVNEPAVNWTDAETRNLHLQDIYYDQDREAASNGGNCYRFELTNGVYGWNLITDEHTLMALNKIADVASDGKLTGGMEKTRVYIEWMAAIQDYLKYRQQAATIGASTAWNTYLTALNALGTYLNDGGSWAVGDYEGSETSDTATPLWINATNRSVTHVIGANEYRACWNAYYEALTGLLSAMGLETYHQAMSKSNVFVTTYQDATPHPVPPYKAGDLWLHTQANGQQKMYIATTTKTASEAWSADDWEDMTSVVINDDVRTNLLRMMETLVDMSVFTDRWKLSSVTNIPFYVCDGVALDGHYRLSAGMVSRYDMATTTWEEVTLAVGDLVYADGTVYQWQAVKSGSTTTYQLVDLEATDLVLTMLAILNSVGSRRIIIWKALDNSATEYDVTIMPNTFSPVKFDGDQQDKLTIQGEGYLYYYNNGKSWEPLGDNKTYSVLQKLGDRIVQVLWNPQTGLSTQITQEVSERKADIGVISSWQSQTDSKIAELNTGLSTKVEKGGSGDNAFATLFAQAVSNDGNIVKQADIQAFVKAVNGVIESGVKISGDKVIFAAGMVLLEDENGNIKFGIDSNGNVYMNNASVAGTFVNGNSTFGVRIKDVQSFTSPRADLLSNNTTRGGLLSIFGRNPNNPNDPSNTYRGIYCEGESEFQGVTQLLRSAANKNADIDALIVEGVDNKGDSKVSGRTVISSYVTTDAQPYTMSSNTSVLVCIRDGNQDITVPSDGKEGQVIMIKKRNAGWCNIKDSSGNTLNSVERESGCVFIIYNGTQWI